VKRPGRIVVQFLEPIEPGLDRRAFMAELHARLDTAADRLIDEARGLPR
jgi:1-acyl-sn-glycerol-3-phosphate acyltransferase